MRVVAVDGEAGSGKSSLCRESATQLGWNYLNTGLLYRTLGVIGSKMGISPSDEEGLLTVVPLLEKELEWDFTNHRVSFRGEDLTDLALSSDGASHASDLAKHPELRRRLLSTQRQLADGEAPGVIVEGRDIGTVVFPEALLKVWVSADPRVRAQRRLEQLGESLDEDSVATMTATLQLRDQQDAQRQAAPMTKAENAKTLDTTGKDFNECVKELIQLITETYPS